MRHDVEDLRHEPRAVVAARDGVRVRPRGRREVAEVGAHLAERGGVVVGDVVDETARERDAGATEVLFGDLFAERLAHDGRPGREDRRVAAHHREVRDRRDERAVAGRRAEDGRHERDPAGAAGLGEHVGGGPGAVPAAVGTEPGAFEQHDQRNPVGDGDLRDAVSLRVGRAADRAGLHGEVLGRDHHRAAIDATGAHDDRVGRCLFAAHERAELLERSGVEKHVDSGAHVELPGGAVLLQPNLSAHGAGRGAALLEILEDGVPVVPAGHGASGP